MKRLRQQSGFAGLIELVVVALALALLGGVAYSYYLSHRPPPAKAPAVTTPSTPAKSTTPTIQHNTVTEPQTNEGTRSGGGEGSFDR